MSSLAQADGVDAPVVKKKEQIRVLPVKGTPQSDASKVFLSFPKPDEVVGSGKVWVQFRTQNYSLAAGSSDFERSKEIAISPEGQTAHVVVDNLPYFTVSQQAIDPFNELGNFRLTYYKVPIPYQLQEGPHTLRIFLARSFGESLKEIDSFQAITFFVGSKEGSKEAPDLGDPYLTYNEPSNELPLRASKPILLDFYISNCELTPDGYKVRLTIDGNYHRMLTSWQPYYIYGMTRGKHTVRLELLDENGAVAPGPFNDVQRTITLE
ncbi:MAG: hypothetical protein KGI80_06450 [Verrucomicrobiota bacterium]|nr:hypothetical protein [Verrucomicrobiota bacterium]